MKKEDKVLNTTVNNTCELQGGMWGQKLVVQKGAV